MFRIDQQPVALTRDLEALTVPAGIPQVLPKGSIVQITQAMGGSFTVYFEGNLYRVAGRDADALGQEEVGLPELPPDATDANVEDLIWDQMRTVYDPEIPINIVDLGLVYECRIERVPGTDLRSVYIQMTVTAPGCGMGQVLVEDVRQKVKLIPTVQNVEVDLVFDPPWNQSMMSEAALLQAGLL
ncbi:MAG: putative Fe-S cluster assembly protein SufT [Gammaproteobacteria bacterium]|nr:putative Fe-S cluster assembly protein SufT [Gammaproteobacteria bacterium]